MSPEPTPDPDPDPDPDPETYSHTVTITNSLNNSYMFRIGVRNANGGYDVVNGGVSTIVTPLVTGFNESTIRFNVYAKAYNNQHPNWNDSYYDDAAAMPITENGNTLMYVAVESSTQFELAFTGSGNNMTLVSRS